MDFELSDEHKMLRDSVRDFMEKEIQPIEEQIDREDKFPDWLPTKLGSLGWLAVTVSEKYGGSGFDYLAHTICIEEMSRVSAAVGLFCGDHGNLCCDNLYRNGNEEQRQKYLPKLCSGERLGALALTEPDAGSDAVAIQTTAKRDGDYYVLNGTKMFTSNMPGGEVVIVYTKTDPAKGARGITAFIVEPGYEGNFTARALEKMGNRGCHTAEVSFEDYRVPRENILLGENRGIEVMMGGLDSERTVLTGWAVGMTQRALDLSISYSKERYQFGKPIGSFQLIQAKLADMYVAVEASRLLSYKAATMIQEAEEMSSGRKRGKGTEVHKVAAAAILYCAESATKAALDAIQIHGGYGYTLDFPVNRLLRDAKLAEIGAGTSEMRRLVIAQELLAGA